MKIILIQNTPNIINLLNIYFSNYTQTIIIYSFPLTCHERLKMSIKQEKSFNIRKRTFCIARIYFNKIHTIKFTDKKLFSALSRVPVKQRKQCRICFHKSALHKTRNKKKYIKAIKDTQVK